jgi:hypothetical protein
MGQVALCQAPLEINRVGLGDWVNGGEAYQSGRGWPTVLPALDWEPGRWQVREEKEHVPGGRARITRLAVDCLDMALAGSVRP